MLLFSWSRLLHSMSIAADSADPVQIQNGWTGDQISLRTGPQLPESAYISC